MSTATPTEADQELSRSLRLRGARILTVFALLWVAAAAASGLPDAAAWAARSAALVVTAVLLVVASRSTTGVVERVRHLTPGWNRLVGAVNLAQFAVLSLVVVLCLGLGRPELVVPAAAVVVGLHFVPLAPAFDQPEYRWTAAGVCAAGVLGLVVLATGAGPEVSRVVVGSLAALSLWATALRLLRRP